MARLIVVREGHYFHSFLSLAHDRLDFLEFEMNSGSEFGKPCDQDSFEILSTGVLDLGVGRLCGRNTGQACRIYDTTTTESLCCTVCKLHRLQQIHLV